MKEIQITDIKGIKVGHAQDEKGGTGCTVILCPAGAAAGVDVRGGAPATRETDLLNSVNMIQQIHAVVLSGGSAYGLDAGSGVMAYLEEKGVGFDTQVALVPIVCGASLFDLEIGDPKCRPDKAMGYEACKNAGVGVVAQGNVDLAEQRNVGVVAQGNVGAGTGACVGKFLGPAHMMKSGIGTYAAQVGDLQVGAIVAVNALGDVIDIKTNQPIAGLLNPEHTAIAGTLETMYAEYGENRNLFSGNTTIGCIVTNAKLSKPQANKIASIAHNGCARAIRPVHTMADGDAIFVMATGEIEVMPDVAGALASEVMAKAINNAAWYAKPAYGLKAACDFVRQDNK